jgi:pullulanase/glycogen debranching enzyme
MTATAATVIETLPGSHFPLGATVFPTGTNFAVASGAADGMRLCLFDQAGTETQIPMRDYDAGVWHAFVPGVTGTGRRVPTLRPGGCAVIRPSCCLTPMRGP